MRRRLNGRLRALLIEKANGSIVSGNENGNNLEQSLYVSMVLDKTTFNDAFGGVAWPFSSTTERAIMLGSISYNQTPGIQDLEGSHYVEVGDTIKHTSNPKMQLRTRGGFLNLKSKLHLSFTNVPYAVH